MPLCVTCTKAAPYLYTVYKTRSNIRLALCDNCQSFADPLIEHPPIVHLLDLVLLKPRVFLHLLYNRGHAPLLAEPRALPVKSETRCQTADIGLHNALQADFARLACISVLAEAIIRLCRSSGPFPDPANIDVEATLRVTGLVTAELIAQLGVSSLLALANLYLRGWWPARPGHDVKNMDGRRQHFVQVKQTMFRSLAYGSKLTRRPIIIPLTLLYTSILPLLLHATLRIWYSPPTPSITSNLHLLLPLPDWIRDLVGIRITDELSHLISNIVYLWQTSDKVWTGTRLLAGMSAGFGLRVVLPLRPAEVSLAVLSGWAASAVVAYVAEGL